MISYNGYKNSIALVIFFTFPFCCCLADRRRQPGAEITISSKQLVPTATTTTGTKNIFDQKILWRLSLPLQRQKNFFDQKILCPPPLPLGQKNIFDQKIFCLPPRLPLQGQKIFLTKKSCLDTERDLCILLVQYPGSSSNSRKCLFW